MPRLARALAALRWSAAGPRRCGTCRHFDADPRHVEAAFGNLAAMSSGFASVRDRDGLCGLAGRYLPAGASCAAHEG